MDFGHVFPFESGFHEGRTKPADHWIGGRKGNEAECERGEEGLAIVVEGIGDYSKAGEGDREKGYGFSGWEGGLHCSRIISLKEIGEEWFVKGYSNARNQNDQNEVDEAEATNSKPQRSLKYVVGSGFNTRVPNCLPGIGGDSLPCQELLFLRNREVVL